jgi:Leucine-rich repeat (LRR) protein
LDFSNSSISGNIPPEIGNLTNLKTLILSWNQLSGSIPPEIGNLTNLNTLVLANNQLSGSIPAEIGNLSNLKELTLGWNNLSGSIPSSISKLKNLEALTLSTSRLTGEIPLEIFDLVQLKSLDFGANQLTGTIPPEIGNLVNLIDLNLGKNQFTGTIPVEIGNLKNLQNNLALYENQLTGVVPASIGNLTKLSNLDLGDNQLTGELPDEIGQMESLIGLSLVKNNFTAVPSILDSLHNLRTLLLNNNQISSLPDLSDLTLILNPWYCMISDNKLDFADFDSTGLDFNYVHYAPQASVAADTQRVENYYEMWVNVGGSGNIYRWFKDNVSIAGNNNDTILLTDSGIYHCEITNSKYPELTLFSDSVEITLEPQYSHGVLLKDYKALIDLYKSTYGPFWFINTKWCSDFDVSYWYGIWVRNFRVHSIILSNNNLKGIPQLVKGTLKSLQSAGTLPPSLGRLDSLEWLDLSKNELTGEVPPEWGNLTNLTGLNLSQNDLTGLPDLTKLTKLEPDNTDLSNNEFDFADYNNLPSEVTGDQTQIIGDTVYIEIGIDNDTVITTSVEDGDTYQWYKDGIEISGANTRDLTIKGSDGAANYNCEIEKTGVSYTIETAPYIVSIATLIEIDEYDERISLYPNPVINKLYVKSVENVQEINIFDITGKCIQVISNPGKTIDITYLKKGIYMIIIKTQNESYVSRVVKL